MEALRKFSYDADVALFHEVLTGALCEDVYNDRNVMTNALEEYLPLAAGHKNLIGREDLYVALREFSRPSPRRPTRRCARRSPRTSPRASSWTSSSCSRRTPT